jgi:hypothetical protein
MMTYHLILSTLPIGSLTDKDTGSKNQSWVQIQWAVISLITVNPNVRNIEQGKAQHRKYKRLKLGGGQAYDRSSD